MSDEILEPCGSAEGSMNPPPADSALPAGWRRVRLGEIATMFSGGTPSAKVEAYYGGGIPWVSISDITGSGKFLGSTEKTLTDVGFANCTARMYPEHTLLFAMYASIGKCCIAKNSVCSSQAILGLYDLRGVDLEYLYQNLHSREKEFVAMGQTGTQANLSKKMVEGIDILLPPIPEQRAIAGVLGRVDRLVDNLAKRIAKKKAIKQGVMADLLTGKRRLVAANDGRACRPATADGRARTPAAPHGDDLSHGERVERGESLTTDYADYTDCEKRDLASRVSCPAPDENLRDSVTPCENDGGAGAGVENVSHGGTETRREEGDTALPAGWRMTTIRESTTVKARIGWQGLTTAEYLKDGPHYLVTGVDIENGRVTWDTCFFVNDSRYQQDKHIQLRAGDVLVSKDGTIGKVAFVESLPRSATLNSGVFVIRSATGDLDQEYLARVFLSAWFDDFIKKITAGSTIAHLYQKDIVNFAFPLPPLPEQRAIAGVLGAMDAEIAKLEAKKTKIERLKQGLMSDLLSGKVRVQV